MLPCDRPDGTPNGDPDRPPNGDPDRPVVISSG